MGGKFLNSRRESDRYTRSNRQRHRHYAIEAGRAGSVQVAGTLVRPTITLVIRYDYGLVRTFTGTLIDGNHLTGSFADSSDLLTFTRR
jgi:hypothetical protein